MTNQLQLGSGESVSAVLRSGDQIDGIRCFQFDRNHRFLLITQLALNHLGIRVNEIRSFLDGDQQAWNVIGQPEGPMELEKVQGLFLPVDNATDPRLMMVRFVVEAI
ncbi:MAG: hypothetical protein ACK5RY_07480 [Dolichospermum sp.]|jgi:hypothetical protein|nr:hypothetical protein [Anabaena sp. 49628_E55]